MKLEMTSLRHLKRLGFRLGVVLRFRIQIRYSVELNLWSAEMDKMYSEV